MIEIWSKPACPYCVRAKNLCEQKGYEYKYYMIGEDFTRENSLKSFQQIELFHKSLHTVNILVDIQNLNSGVMV